MAIDPATITLIARLGTQLITALINAGKNEDAEAVRAILSRAAVNFDELIAWSETSPPRPFVTIGDVVDQDVKDQLKKGL